jgi:microsomal dipeptidase-like Zn-dependent dipeptidase
VSAPRIRSTRWAFVAIIAATITVGRTVAGTDARVEQPAVDLANRCVAIEAVASGKFIAATEAGGYRAASRGRSGAARFYLKPSGLGTYLLQDEDGMLPSAGGGGSRITRAGTPGRLSEWTLAGAAGGSLAIASAATGRGLRAAPGSGKLDLSGARGAGRGRLFDFVPIRGCRPFPEAKVGARGRPFQGTNRDGTVFGFADAHLHITAEMRAGGRVIHGRSFHRFGITRALGGDERDHGPDGSLDVTGNLLRTGLPFGTHDTHGWPSFAGWPVHDTNTHQQTYYVWLKRAWKAGERLVVAQTIEDEPICEIEPRRSHSCDETHTIELEIRRLRQLERYIDAQSGGRGRGWFRLVYSPRQARHAIEDGKLAVLIGIESSNLFGCSQHLGRPRCTRRDIDRGIHRYRRLGVRTMFVAHWVDNALAGAALEGGAKGVFINIFNRFQTGRYVRTEPCKRPSEGEEVETLNSGELGVLADFFPAAAPLAAEGMPTYPPGRQCNARGLTRLGRYAIRRLIANHILIEADHLSERARREVLTIAERKDYPLVSSHNGTGGAWTRRELERLYALGGFASVTPDTARALADKVLAQRRYRSEGRYFGVGLGTDTGGFASLPGPAGDAARNPLAYPFRSYDGEVVFGRQRTGERVYDLNSDGVAHYGLFPDLLADVERRKRGRKALAVLFRSAEAYLRTWRRASSG